MKNRNINNKKELSNEEAKVRLKELTNDLLQNEFVSALTKAIEVLRKDFSDTESIYLIVSPEQSSFIFTEDDEGEEYIYEYPCPLIEEYESLSQQLYDDGSVTDQVACEWVSKGLSKAKKKNIFNNLFPEGSVFSIYGGYTFDEIGSWDSIFEQKY